MSRRDVESSSSFYFSCEGESRMGGWDQLLLIALGSSRGSERETTASLMRPLSKPSLHPQSTSISRVPVPVYVPSSELGSPTPSFASGWGVGGVPIPTTWEKLSTLPTLCLHPSPANINGTTTCLSILWHLLLSCVRTVRNKTRMWV